MWWLTLIQLVWEIVKWILSRPKSEHAPLLARLRAAKLKAKSGDSSDLEALRKEMLGDESTPTINPHR